LILDKHDIPHIAYFDVDKKIAKYATQVNGKWQIQAVDAVGGVAFPDRNGIALDENGTPYISYYDSRNGLLKVAHKNGQGWVAEVVDTDLAGFTSSMQICNGMIWVTYSGGPRGGLRFAHRPVTPPEPDNQSQARNVAK
jgi:hypothetical protein